MNMLATDLESFLFIFLNIYSINGLKALLFTVLEANNLYLISFLVINLLSKQ